MTLRQLDLIAGAVVTAAYFVVFLLLVVGLIRTKQATRSRLGLATALVFFAAAAYRGASVVLVARGQAINDEQNLGLTTALDVLTALVGLFYLSLRKQFGSMISGVEDDDDAVFSREGRTGAGSDPLTGLATGRKALEVLRRQLSATSLSGEKLAVLMVYIDQIEDAEGRRRP